MFKSDESINVLIGKNISRTSNVQITDRSATATYIANGEIVVLDETDAVLAPGDTYSDSKYIRIAQGRGATEPLNFSLRIDGAGVTKFSGASYSAAQEQITSIGYNGTSGSIDAINANDYKVSVIYKHNKDMWSEQLNKRVYRYTSDLTATQQEIAADLTKQIVADPFKAVIAERLVDGTFTALSNNATVTNGATLVTSNAHGLSVGSVVRIDGTTGTTPAYVVASVPTANTFHLDVPYQGASGTVLAANIGAMSAITAWGIRLTGAAIPFEVGLYKYLKAIFEVKITNFGNTPVTTSQESNKGIGAWQSVAELEWFAYGFDGITNRIGHPVPAGRTDVVSGANYDVITIEWVNTHKSYPVSGVKPAKNLLYIFIVENAAQTTDVLAQLNPWMASVPGAFATVTV